ncbi:MAG: zinc D-Ala-D-Ala carboxypeptidase [Chloroflexota bacterium]|jgi:D-alanyl-D-alanine carboxypeptidase|nr:zinc D-Ala-D-Ala carboxypeptidase [Chloroflexota bacterium]
MTAAPGRIGSVVALLVMVASLAACSATVPSGSPSGPAGSGGPPGSARTATSARTPGTSGPGTAPSGSEATPEGSPVPLPTPGGPTSPPSTPDGSGDALPECAYKNKDASGDPDRDWATMVLDTIYRLPADFAPRKLVDTSTAGLQPGYEVIPDVVDDLRALHEASMDDRAEIAVRWAYRSYAEQQGAFGHWVRTIGREQALKTSARPGHSEHQMGTAIDFRSADSLTPPWEYDDWATTVPGHWLGENGWRFGFVMSYPKGLEAETCYGYEPWHFRYVGRDLAAQIHDSGLAPRAFLWELSHGG